MPVELFFVFNFVSFNRRLPDDFSSKISEFHISGLSPQWAYENGKPPEGFGHPRKPNGVKEWEITIEDQLIISRASGLIEMQEFTHKPFITVISGTLDPNISWELPWAVGQISRDLRGVVTISRSLNVTWRAGESVYVKFWEKKSPYFKVEFDTFLNFTNMGLRGKLDVGFGFSPLPSVSDLLRSFINFPKRDLLIHLFNFDLVYTQCCLFDFYLNFRIFNYLCGWWDIPKIDYFKKKNSPNLRGDKFLFLRSEKDVLVIVAKDRRN